MIRRLGLKNRGRNRGRGRGRNRGGNRGKNRGSNRGRNGWGIEKRFLQLIIICKLNEIMTTNQSD